MYKVLQGTLAPPRHRIFFLEDTFSLVLYFLPSLTCQHRTFLVSVGVELLLCAISILHLYKEIQNQLVVWCLQTPLAIVLFFLSSNFCYFLFIVSDKTL